MLEDLKRLAFYHQTTLHEHATVMAHREGRRSLVVAIEQAIAAAGMKETPSTDE